MAEKNDAFTKAQAAAESVEKLSVEIKEKQAALKKARADLAQHRKTVLAALGRKPRGPRKAKVTPESAQSVQFSNGD